MQEIVYTRHLPYISFVHIPLLLLLLLHLGRIYRRVSDYQYIPQYAPPSSPPSCFFVESIIYAVVVNFRHLLFPSERRKGFVFPFEPRKGLLFPSEPPKGLLFPYEPRKGLVFS